MASKGETNIQKNVPETHRELNVIGFWGNQGVISTRGTVFLLLKGSVSICFAMIYRLVLSAFCFMFYIRFGWLGKCDVCFSANITAIKLLTADSLY